jgi:hypothetical protein
MKIKIISDGRATMLIDVETGKPIDAKLVGIHLTPNGPAATLLVERVEMDLITDAQVQERVNNEEREACAKIAESAGCGKPNCNCSKSALAREVATKIRNRGAVKPSVAKPLIPLAAAVAGVESASA